jgi:hypothetical protein
MSLPGAWSNQKLSLHASLNKTCQRVENLLPLQRLLTTIVDSKLDDLNFEPYQQFSVWMDVKELQPSLCS